MSVVNYKTCQLAQCNIVTQNKISISVLLKKTIVMEKKKKQSQEGEK